MRRNNQLVPIERSGNFNVANNAISMQLLSETEAWTVSRRNYSLSLEKWRKEGRLREGEREREKGGREVWKRERERYTNENAYAPRTRRVPLIFLLRQRAPVTLHERMKISRLLCRETVSGYNSLLTSISHLAGPRICTKIRETSGR